MLNGHGGKRNGAGRPRGSKSQRTLIRETGIAEAAADAEFALGLFVDAMRDEKMDLAARLVCGREVMDRVWGRPTQHKIIDATVETVKEYVGISPDDWDEDEPEDNQASGAI